MGEWPPHYADARTLEGKLQRGLGSGYLEALEAPRAEVHAMLNRNIKGDPRLDHHLDNRDGYYGDLTLAIGLPLDDLRDFVGRFATDENEDSFLAVTVLVHMVKRGHAEAERILRDYVLRGPFWNSVLWMLGDAGISQGWTELIPSVVERIAADPEFYALDWEPYATWARAEPRLTAMARSREMPTKVPTPDLESKSTEALFKPSHYSLRAADVLAARTDDADRAAVRAALDSRVPYSRALAALVLAKQGDFSVMPVALGLVSRGTRPPSVRLIAERALLLGPAEFGLHLARKWRSSPSWPRQIAAFDLLELHATADDIGWVTKRLRRASAERDEDRFIVTNLAEIVAARFPGREFPLLKRRFDAFTYSYGRHFLAEALAVTDPTFAATRAFTSLWDCESETRLVAAEHVDLGVPGALERLREMASDPVEDERVVEIATKRLETA